MENTSGQGKSAVVPQEINHWNWGAFFFNWIWGIGNQTYMAFLAFVPLFGILMLPVLGMKGNEWAWRNKHWESIEEFKRIQHKWAMAVPVVLGVIVLLAAILSMSVMAGLKKSEPVRLANQILISSPAAVAALGTPIEMGWGVSGSMESTGPGGKADLAVSVHGPQAKGKLYIKAVKDMDEWKLTELVLKVEGKSEPINLL